MIVKLLKFQTLTVISSIKIKMQLRIFRDLHSCMTLSESCLMSRSDVAEAAWNITRLSTQPTSSPLSSDEILVQRRVSPRQRNVTLSQQFVFVCSPLPVKRGIVELRFPSSQHKVWTGKIDNGELTMLLTSVPLQCR